MTRLKHLTYLASTVVLMMGCRAFSPPMALEAVEAGDLSSPSPTPPSIPTAILLTGPSPTTMPSESLATAEADLIGLGVVTETVPDVTLQVELMYYERWMRVRQTIRLENTSPDPWDEIVLNVPLNYILDAFYLDGMTISLGDKTQTDLPPLPEQTTVLRAPLPRPAQPGEAVSIELAYRIVIPPVAPTDWPPRGTTGWRYDQSFDLIQAGEWYPLPVPYIAGEGWYTWRYHPVGDPTVYPLTDYHLTVTTDEGVTVASGGLITQEGTSWHFAVKGGRGIAFIASDDYDLVEQEIGGVPVRSYYLREHAEAGQAALEVAVRSLALYSALYGPYPYDSLTVAENGFFGGMEYSAFVTISDWAYRTYIGQPASVLTALVAHETAHQWWYGAVGNDQANEPWLDESLAFYSELLYFEHYHPDFVNWWWDKRVNQYEPSGPVDVTIYSYDRSSDFILLMYGQAARFIHELRTVMGDEAFFAFLQDYYRTYAGRIATKRDFFEMADRHTEADLRPLLEAYFANPELEP